MKTQRNQQSKEVGVERTSSMCRPRMILLVFCFVSVCLCSLQSFGTTVTSGEIDIFGGSGTGAFTLSGNGFTAAGSFDTIVTPWQVLLGCPCLPGDTLGVDGFVSGNDFFGGGTATIGSIQYSNVDWGSLGVFFGSVFTIVGTGPPIVLHSGPGTYTTTFSFTGALFGESPTGPVDLPGLSGTGVVMVDIYAVGDLLYLQQATYTFATPEPGSLALFGSGVLGIGGLLRKRFFG